MNDLVKSFYDRNKDIWGLPQNFRGVDFFPIKLIDSKSKSIFYSIFQIPKNYIKDDYIEKISYLRFLVQVNQYALNSKGKEVQEKIIDFLENITNKKVIFKTDAPDNLIGLYISNYIKLYIDDVEFDENDFDIIREIILLQNGSSTEFVESYIPELEEKLISENSSGDSLTPEEEIFKFCSLMGIPVTAIKDYTIFQFNHHFQEQVLLSNFNTYGPLEIAGTIKSKNGKEIVKPYLIHTPEKGRYGSILISWDSFIDSHRDQDMRDINGNSVMKFDNDKK
jgi:hypothetical protein